MTMFPTPEDSHKHSLETLNALAEYDEFMESIDTLVDLGCGTGLDLEWWATRTTRDDHPIPLNINCTGVDLSENLPIADNYLNATYQKTDFEEVVYPPEGKLFDVLWCHNAFQYVTNPLQTLSKWWNITSDGGMLVLIVPQSSTIQKHQLAFTQTSNCFYHHSLASLIHMLAISGWDCRRGYFLKKLNDPWMHAIVYKSNHAPMNPKTTSLYDLLEKDILPESAEKSIYKNGGLLDQRDLLLPWLDQSLTWYGQQ